MCLYPTKKIGEQNIIIAEIEFYHLLFFIMLKERYKNFYLFRHAKLLLLHTRNNSIIASCVLIGRNNEKNKIFLRKNRAGI